VGDYEEGYLSGLQCRFTLHVLSMNPELKEILTHPQHHCSGSRSGSGSGSIPLTNGSGSWRPKNMRICFRIWNTAHHYKYHTGTDFFILPLIFKQFFT
jgi:hypothetical protein